MPARSARCFRPLIGTARHLISAADRLRFRWLGGRAAAGEGESFPGTTVPVYSGSALLLACLVHTVETPVAGVVLLIGIGDRLVYWRNAQTMLRTHGVASLAFQYSGSFGSEGKGTPAAFERDGRGAYAALRAFLPPGVPIYLLGFSLGTGVLAEIVNELEPVPAGIVLCQPYTSFRDAAERIVRPARLLTRLLPDVWRTRENLRRLRVPLLLVHAEGDRLFPSAMAVELLAEARESGQPVSLALIAGYTHNAVYLATPEDYWKPILEFILGGGLATNVSPALSRPRVSPPSR